MPITKNNSDKPRFELVDLLRGTAILMMFVYHFSFDLDYFGLIDEDFYRDPFWRGFRVIIVSLFLLLVGISLHLATRRQLRRDRYLRRLGLLLLYAGLVSLATWLAFPRSMIFFGILHFIAVASVLGLLFTRFYRLNLLLGIILILLGIYFSHPLFNHPALQWLGMVTRLPITEDYVPLLPWFGVVLLGIALGKYLVANSEVFKQWHCDYGWQRLLRWGGQHSLHIYMLHQPIFIGTLYIILSLTGMLPVNH